MIPSAKPNLNPSLRNIMVSPSHFPFLIPQLLNKAQELNSVSHSLQSPGYTGPCTHFPYIFWVPLPESWESELQK